MNEKTGGKIRYKHALVCDVELTNGKQTRAIVIFNNDELNFEEINTGMNFAFMRCHNVHKSSKIFCRIKSGELKTYAIFNELIYNK